MRKALVLVVVAAALGLIVWAGITNYRARQAQKAAAAAPTAPQLALSPDNGNGGASGAQGDAPVPPSPLLGKMAPDFKLKSPDGKTVTLASFRGKPIMVNFWATWCGPCQFEIPWLAKLQTKYAGQGFQILGVSDDEVDLTDKTDIARTKVAVQKSATKLGINYPVLLGGATVSDKWGGVDLLPQSFYIDKTGKIVAVITGAGSPDEAEADVQKALGKNV